MAVFQGEGSLASSQGSGGLMSPPPVEQKQEEVQVKNNEQDESTPPPRRPTITNNIDEGVSDDEVNEVVTEFAPAPLGKENVRNLQTYLNKTPNAPKLVVDGMWGPNTSAALRDFKKYKKELYAQEDFEESGFVIDRPKIKTDGILDSEITGIINADLAAQNTSALTKYKYINDVNNYNFGLVDKLLKKQTDAVVPLEEGQSIVEWFASKMGLSESKHETLIRNAIGGRKIIGRENAWCASFLYAAIKNTAVNSSGITREGINPNTKSPYSLTYETRRAHRYQDLGTPIYDYNPQTKKEVGALESVIPGDMIVFNSGNSRLQDNSFKETTGHVGIVIQRYSDGAVLVLGGNQDNEVSLKMFSPSTVLEDYPAGFKINRLNNLPSTDPRLIAELTSLAAKEIQSTGG
jgi:peptidoglycan hydrolase-like protein with peptidoglycan-binding domain